MKQHFIGTVVGKSEQGNGYMVEVYTGGQVVTYGPMQFLSAPNRRLIMRGGNARTNTARTTKVPNRDPYKSGDQVLIANIMYRDLFIIVGLAVDMLPPPRDPVELDTDGDGIIDVIVTEASQ